MIHILMSHDVAIKYLVRMGGGGFRCLTMIV